jgi:DNA-binding transcriptional regulator YiaG
MSEIKKIKGNFTNYELSVMLSHGTGKVPEDTVQRWVSGRRNPRGPAASLICLVSEILENGQVTKKELLSKIGSGIDIKLDGIL